MGEMFYTVGNPRQSLLMVAWNGGLGAMIGVVQDVFENDHTGLVYLFHSVTDADYLYYCDELREIGKYYPNFRYLSCVELGLVPQGCRGDPVNRIIQESFPKLSDWKIFLCGARDQVHKIQRQSYLAGAGMKDIYFEVTKI